MDCSGRGREDGGRSLGDASSGIRGVPKADTLLVPPQDNAVMATTSAFVVEPGEEIGKCSIIRPCQFKKPLNGRDKVQGSCWKQQKRAIAFADEE